MRRGAARARNALPGASAVSDQPGETLCRASSLRRALRRQAIPPTTSSRTKPQGMATRYRKSSYPSRQGGLIEQPPAPVE